MTSIIFKSNHGEDCDDTLACVLFFLSWLFSLLEIKSTVVVFYPQLSLSISFDKHCGAYLSKYGIWFDNDPEMGLKYYL